MPISGAHLDDPGDRPSAIDAASAVAEYLKAGRCVAVHCSAGLHRTGIVGYLTLRLLGKSKPAAFELLGQVRWETRAELESIHYGSKGYSAQAVDFISVAEELVLQVQGESTSSSAMGYGS